MTAKQDYLALIRAARDPRKAATYIRAFALGVAASCATSPAYMGEAIELIRDAEKRAQTLEMAWSEDAGPHPWRRWLREWGYTVTRRQTRQAEVRQ